MARKQRRRRDPPPLNHDIINDDGELWNAIDAVLRADPKIVELGKEVAQQQGLLKALVNESAWCAFLIVEELVTKRSAAALIIVSRWVAESLASGAPAKPSIRGEQGAAHRRKGSPIRP